MTSGAPTGSAFAALVPIFCIVFACLIPIHWVDREADAAVGKRTLVARIGPWEQGE